MLLLNPCKSAYGTTRGGNNAWSWVGSEMVNRIKAIICSVTGDMAKCISVEINSLIEDSTCNCLFVVQTKVIMLDGTVGLTLMSLRGAQLSPGVDLILTVGLLSRFPLGLFSHRRLCYNQARN